MKDILLLEILKSSFLFERYQSGIFIVYRFGILIAGVMRYFQVKRTAKEAAYVADAACHGIEYESEQHQPIRDRRAGSRYATLIAIADYFPVSIDYVLGRTNGPKMND